MRIGVSRLVVMAAVAASLGCGRPVDGPAPPDRSKLQQDPTTFVTHRVCKACHARIVEQWSESMHSQALTDPLFRAHYYREFLPAFHEDPQAFAKERSCIGCHSPIISLTQYKELRRRTTQAGAGAANGECDTCHTDPPLKLNQRTPGVECDVCHRIEGYRGERPGNSNYILEPGLIKFGPLPYKNDFHREYRELQTRADFCGICHESANRYGLEIRTTYQEWKESPFPARGIQCQDCHMNQLGFLSAGRPVFESGKVAKMTMGIKTKTRDKLSTHRFPGAHSKSQVEGALTLEFEVDETYADPGEPLTVKVIVSNEKAGHRIPTGSVELRSAWLELTVRLGDDELPVRLLGDHTHWGISGASESDDEVFGDVIPDGNRLYRVVFVDGDGDHTLFSYDARKRIFDNRLPAGATRTETYEVDVPTHARGWLQLDATLYYLRYPPGFAKRLKVSDVLPLPFAWAKGEILVKQ